MNKDRLLQKTLHKSLVIIKEIALFLSKIYIVPLLHLM